MAFALAKEQKQFINRMICSGRYNNQSEIVRAALRRLEQEESDYLTPPILTMAQIERIYGLNREEEARENRFGESTFAAVRRAARKGPKA
jgi:putative addiction module CopG family antidote